MVEIYNDVSSIEELVHKHDSIYLYGAGLSCKLLLYSFWDDVLKGHVNCIIDANKELSGTSVNIGTDTIKIKDVEAFFDELDESGQIVLLLTPAFSSLIVEQLDRVEKFDGAIIYLLPMICHNQCSEHFNIKSEECALIPKKIHYFWIGGNLLPDEYRRNIEGWRKLNPEYEIYCWNEENYDFNSMPYMKEAYLSGDVNLMYATDYARMDILYRYGGIYLDTDVELLKPLDELLYNKAFIGIEENAQLNSGSAIGAISGHPMIKKLMDCYVEEHFWDVEGKPKKVFNTYYETKCFIDNGYKMVNCYQRICDMICFPRELFMPICFAGMDDCYTDQTISAHKINPEHHRVNRMSYEKWKDRIR